MIFNKLSLILIIGLGSLQAHASFDENSRRYLSAQEIIQAMQMHFDVVDDCAKVTGTNSSMLGVNSAVTGNAISPAPTQGTVQFIAGCVSRAIDRAPHNIQYPNAFSKLQSLLGEELVKKVSERYAILPPDDAFLQALGSNWTLLAPTLREQVIARVVFVMLGSDDVINDFGLIDSGILKTKLTDGAQNKPQATVLDVIKFITVNLAVRDEFLSY